MIIDEPVPPPRVVLVTGVSSHVAARTAVAVAQQPGVERVLAVDTAPPRRGFLDGRRAADRVEFVRADIRNPLIARVMADAQVDTVVHAALRSTPGAYGGTSALKDMNVLGTMQLLAACQGSTTLRRLVVRSATDVYGSSPRSPAVFTEDSEPRSRPGGGFAQQVADVEGYVRAFARRRPDVALTVLRLAGVIGPSVDTELTRYFALPVVPTVLGHDPRVQLLHEQDAVAVLVLAATSAPAGTVNVAGDGVLLLSQALRRAGHVAVAVPSPMVDGVASVLRGTGLVGLPPGLSHLLDVGRVVETTRLRDRLGFTPRWTTIQAFDDFARGRGFRPAQPPAPWRAVESAVLAIAGRIG